MSRSAHRVVLATAALAALAVAAPASAAPTPSSALDCGNRTVVVDGFGRGQTLHVVGSTSNFVVTRAVRADGTVVFDSPAAADRPLLTCTAVTPAGGGFTFTGFFTPAS